MESLSAIVKGSPVPEVKKRIVDELWSNRKNGESASLEVILNAAIYHELHRLKQSRHSKKTAEELQFWNSARRRLQSGDDREIMGILDQVTDRYLTEIDGNFDLLVYRFSTTLVPRLLQVLLYPFSFKDALKGLVARPDLTGFLKVRGKAGLMQELAEKGTVILAPTHISNMDSIVLGWTIYELGLPPFIYGAGINLFTNRALRYFLNNLGAYKVDRNKTDLLYKKILKEYSTRAIELGRHSLFFPGGTRSRSGGLENKLKLGLLGTGLQAYVNNLINEKPNPNIYIFPCNLSYHMVLEAETLISDSLKAMGKARYIIEDDESSRPAQVIRFIKKVIRFNSSIHVYIGEPIDPFGNKVGEDGVSIDPRGRPIDIRRYVQLDGKPVHNSSRDAEYTREMGRAITGSFIENNIILSTHLICYTLFKLMKKRFPDLSLFQMLRTDPGERTFPARDVIPALESILKGVIALEKQGVLKLDPTLAAVRAQAAFRHAARLLNYFDKAPALTVKEDVVKINKPEVIYFYYNRLSGYGLDADLKEDGDAE